MRQQVGRNCDDDDDDDDGDGDAGDDAEPVRTSEWRPVLSAPASAASSAVSGFRNGLGERAGAARAGAGGQDRAGGFGLWRHKSKISSLETLRLCVGGREQLLASVTSFGDESGPGTRALDL